MTIYSYHAICTYLDVYPSDKHQVFSEEIKDIAEAMIKRLELVISSPSLSPSVVSNYHSKMTDEDKEGGRKKEKANPNIGYYIKKTSLDSDKTLLAIAPITFKGLAGMVLKRCCRTITAVVKKSQTLKRSDFCNVYVLMF